MRSPAKSVPAAITGTVGDRPLLYGRAALAPPSPAALRGRRVPLAWSRPGPAAEMSVVPRCMDRGMHWCRPPHHQRPAISGDCRCVAGVPAGPLRHKAIPIGQKPAFQCGSLATRGLSEARMAMRGQEKALEEILLPCGPDFTDFGRTTRHPELGQGVVKLPREPPVAAMCRYPRGFYLRRWVGGKLAAWIRKYCRPGTLQFWARDFYYCGRPVSRVRRKKSLNALRTVARTFKRGEVSAVFEREQLCVRKCLGRDAHAILVK